MMKRQFGYAKVCYRGLAKNTACAMAVIALKDTLIARAVSRWHLP
ncbi:MAG: hypothetical protein IPG66_15205 [Hydrogenophilales bacterium]|nr:hypothetical protein [Hydrogenophilales bacterium]